MPRQSRHGNYDKTIGRIYSVAPTDEDRFYIRTLLVHTPNVQGFYGPHGLKPTQDMTWRAAAELKGLVESDSEFIEAMDEATLTATPFQLRLLFAQLLVHCEVGNAPALWDRFKESMSEDYRRKYPVAKAEDSALHDIDLLLHKSQQTVVTPHGLPKPVNFDRREFEERALRQAMNFDPEAAKTELEDRVPKLNDGQKRSLPSSR